MCHGFSRSGMSTALSLSESSVAEMLQMSCQKENWWRGLKTTGVLSDSITHKIFLHRNKKSEGQPSTNARLNCANRSKWKAFEKILLLCNTGTFKLLFHCDLHLLLYCHCCLFLWLYQQLFILLSRLEPAHVTTIMVHLVSTVRSTIKLPSLTGSDRNPQSV